MNNPVNKKHKGNVVISQKKYEALLQSVKVTSEYLQEKYTSFNSAKDLIKNLKNLK